MPHVVVIDDHSGMRELIGIVLRLDATLTVAAFAEVPEALEHMAGNPADVVLIDRHLPDCSDPVGVVGEAFPKLPIIEISAQPAARPSLGAALGLGKADLISKLPLAISALLSPHDSNS